MQFLIPAAQMKMWLAFLGLIGGSIAIHRILRNGWALPDVPFYLMWGMIWGPVLGFIRVASNSPLTLNILPIAAGVILFEGGSGIPLDGLRRMWTSITSLATLGVLIASSVLALTLHGIWQLPWVISWMIAIVVANTDPASVIPVLSHLSVSRKIRITLEAESAFNDTMSATMTSILIVALISHASFTGVLAQSFKQVFVGLVVGLVAGYVSGAINSKYPAINIVTALIAALIPYLLARDLGSNGYIASFAAGLSWQIRRHSSATRVVSRLSTVARIGIFSWLGLMIPLGVLQTFWPLAVGTSLILMFVARPLTVLGSVGWISTWRIPERLFMMWVRETGAISAVLAIQVSTQFPLWRPPILAIVFSSILFTVGIQAPSTGILARMLGLVSAQKEKIPESG